MGVTRQEIYKPLDPNFQEIRVVHLSPGQFSSALHGSLSTTTLTQPVSYEGLSYTWGTEYSSTPLFLDGYGVKITKNLEVALRYLRREDEERVLWIDAVCINQGKEEDAIEERNQQIQQMRLVYEKAATVVAWLGEEDEITGLVAELVNWLRKRDITQEAISASLQDPVRRLAIQTSSMESSKSFKSKHPQVVLRLGVFRVVHARSALREALHLILFLINLATV